jgi:hypothetical protein
MSAKASASLVQSGGFMVGNTDSRRSTGSSEWIARF